MTSFERPWKLPGRGRDYLLRGASCTSRRRCTRAHPPRCGATAWWWWSGSWRRTGPPGGKQTATQETDPSSPRTLLNQVGDLSGRHLLSRVESAEVQPRWKGQVLHSHGRGETTGGSRPHFLQVPRQIHRGFPQPTESSNDTSFQVSTSKLPCYLLSELLQNFK